MYIKESVDYVGITMIHPSSPNIMKPLKTPNAEVVSLFRYIMWPTGVSIHNKTLKVDKIHHYNDIKKIAKTPISPSSSSVNKPISQTVQVFAFIFA